MYNYIIKTEESSGQETYEFDQTELIRYPQYQELLNSVHLFIRCAKKGIKSDDVAKSLTTTMLFTLNNFKLHNKRIKAYAFGSTAQTYLFDNKILKKYNEKLRWTTAGHDDSEEIFVKEVEILKRLQKTSFVPRLISFDEDNELVLSYEGESLWNDWKLPEDWEHQINEIFDGFDQHGIFYPEFRLQNILVKDGKITFVDFGLAEFAKKNDENRTKFLKYLRLLDNKLKTIDDPNRRWQLCTTFFKNLNIS